MSYDDDDYDYYYYFRSRDSVVGLATGYGLDDREVGVRAPVRSRIFTSPCRPGRHWSPPSLYPMGTGSKAAGA
jgi:hypothetical protein